LKRLLGGQRIVKAAAEGGSTGDSDLGAYGVAIGPWSDAARTRSAFYRILNDGVSCAPR
jgi:hypothetical protein